MLYLVRTKACRRCGGDLSLGCDIYGIYIECIQCGATVEAGELAKMMKDYTRSAQDVLRARPATPGKVRIQA